HGPPFVQPLVPKQKTQLGPEIEQLRRGRIMAGPNRVAAHRLQDLQLALIASAQSDRAETAEIIVVIANSLDFQALSIQQQALVLGEFDRPDAEGAAGRIENLPPNVGGGV